METSVERLFQGYRLPRTAPAVEVAAAALRDNEIEPSYITTGGGSDANVFIAGRPAGGEPGERHRAQPPARRVGHVEALETMLEVTVSLVRQAALVAAQTSLED